jgi:hypothetical protein
MRTIIDIANEYVTQDNMCTSYPIAIALQEVREEVAAEGCDYDRLEVFINGDAHEFHNDKDVWEYYAECEDIQVQSAKKRFKDDLMYFNSLEDIVELLFPDSRIVPIKREHHYSDNMFLTMTGYKDHIASNGHNLRQPRPYLIHLYRNHEMFMVAHQLMDIATVPKEMWNRAALEYYSSWKAKCKVND